LNGCRGSKSEVMEKKFTDSHLVNEKLNELMELVQTRQKSSKDHDKVKNNLKTKRDKY
jgi:hypothetical protein